MGEYKYPNRQRGEADRFFHPLVQFPNDCSGLSPARPKLGDWNSIRVFHVSVKGPSTWAVFQNCPPRQIGRELDQKLSSQALNCVAGSS